MELDLKLQPKQLEAARYWLDQTTEEILYGGAKGGAKSYTGCSLIFSDALTYPGTHYFIARHDLNDLKRFTTPSIYEVFEHWKINPLSYLRFNGQDNYFDLNNGSKVYYIDCKHQPRDPDYHRFGSMQFTRGWIEEIGQVPDLAIINLGASIGRWKNNEYDLKGKLFLTCNPNKGYAYREFFIPQAEGRLEPHRKFVKSLPTDNKYLSGEYIQRLRRLPKNERKRLLLGDWQYDDNPRQLVAYDAIVDMWTNTHVEAGPRYITVDVARYGKDKTVLWVWYGFQVVEIKVIKKSDLNHVRDVVLSMKQKHNVPMSHIWVDEGGLGAGVVDMLRGCKGFIANRKPQATKIRENFDNLKSQCGFRLADKINASEIWIKTEDCKVETIEEMEVLQKKKEDTDDKQGLIKKEDMKEILGRSPDHLDSMIMRMAPELTDIDYFS